MIEPRGFTLIELMIVVAIIGVLAAIAIPQYQDYISRTQLNRAYSEVAAYRGAIEEGLMNGVFNPTLDASYVGAVRSSLTIAVPTISFDVNDNGYGDMRVTLGNEASAAIAGSVLIIEREQGESWGCFINNSVPLANSTWKVGYLPSGCVLHTQSHPVVGALGDD